MAGLDPAIQARKRSADRQRSNRMPRRRRFWIAGTSPPMTIREEIPLELQPGFSSIDAWVQVRGER